MLEILLKDRKDGKRQASKETPRHDVSATHQDAPAKLTPPEQQRIKRREFSAKDDGLHITPPGGSRIRITPAHKTVRGTPATLPSRAESPQIKAKPGEIPIASGDKIAVASPRSQERSKRTVIKSKDAYIQRQFVSRAEIPPKTITQGQQNFIQEQGRKAAEKRTDIQRARKYSAPKAKETDTPVFISAAQKYSAKGCDVPSNYPAQVPEYTESPSAPSVQSAGETIRWNTIRQTPKAPASTERLPVTTKRQATVKTDKPMQKRFSLQKRKPAQGCLPTQKVINARRSASSERHSVRAAQRTVQTTAKASQQVVQTARTAAKTTAVTAKTAVKAAATALKASVSAVQELAAVIAAGSWIVVAIVLLICMAGLLIASPFGVLFMDGSSVSGTNSPSAMIAQLNQELDDKLSELQASGSYDRVEIQGQPPEWWDVLSVFAVRSAMEGDRPDLLQEVFWDMTKIISENKTIEHPASGDSAAWTETILFITIKPRTVDDMRVFYQLSDQQNRFLDELLTEENQALWDNLLAGGSGEIVSVALSQVGNVGGRPYWSWYGFSSHVNWCACFVSWCANECGYIEAGAVPRFASCTAGSNWFKARDLWKPRGSTPNPGELIFFDWDADGLPDHVGIVERVENGTVYTVEGNSNDRCRQRSYSLGYSGIFGYGTPNY